MDRPVSKYRLQSNAFDREDEEAKIPPKRVVFLSVEGDNTEVNYFGHLDRHLDHSIIQIEILRHKHGDGYSDPQYVVELLSEYMSVREGNLIPEDSLQRVINSYTKETIRKYLDDPSSLPAEEQKKMKGDLLLAGIDIDYRRYLQRYGNDDDVFAVVLDRDCGNHSEQLMKDCVQKCIDNNYICCITNPCFEFWLLLHLCNVKEEYTKKELDQILANPKISNRHTVTSSILSERAHHTKSIGTVTFDKYYYPNIGKAMIQAKEFSTTISEIYNKLGTNLPQLLNVLGFNG